MGVSSASASAGGLTSGGSGSGIQISASDNKGINIEFFIFSSLSPLLLLK